MVQTEIPSILSPLLEKQARKVLASPSRRRGLEYLRSPLKRRLDIVAGLAASAVALPVIGISALTIFASDRHNPFVQTTRINPITNKIIRYVKVRSMIPNAEFLESEMQKPEGVTVAELKREGRDPRITRVGRVLRRLSVDEAPLTLLALFGSISLVGPHIFTNEQWDQHIVPHLSETDYNQLHSYLSKGVKFGLTGLYGIFGRADLSFGERIALERLYLENANFLSDLKILARTIPAILSRRGAY